MKHLVLLLAVTVALLPGFASAQGSAPARTSGATAFAINLALGSITGVVGRALSQKPVLTGLWQGAVGGGVSYAGKAIAGRDNSWGDAAGRTVNAVGASMVANAARSDGILSRIVIPYGPIRIYAERVPRLRLRPKLDIANSIVALVTATSSYARLDLGRSVTSGMFVFHLAPSAESQELRGQELAGVIFVRERIARGADDASYERDIISHEMVHVLQYDFSFIAWSERTEQKLLSYVDGGERFFRFVDVGINVPVHAGLNKLVPYSRRPWEQEARTLAP